MATYFVSGDLGSGCLCCQFVSLVAVRAVVSMCNVRYIQNRKNEFSRFPDIARWPRATFSRQVL